MSMRMGEEGWRKGPWTSEEDRVLIEHVKLHGEGRWNSVSMLTGLKRNGKSCRLRWVNYLRPDLKRGQITPHEEKIIIELHARWGNRWSTIARSLPGRTDNEIKNYWRTHFKKKGNPTLENSEKAKARLLRRQHFQQQQQQLLLCQKQQNAQMAEMKTISPILQEEYNTNFMKQYYENPKDYVMANNTTDDFGFLYSMLSNYVTVPPEATVENNMWDGLWSFDHVNGNRSYAIATNSGNPLHNSATPTC